jgi:hypothetical protein
MSGARSTVAIRRLLPGLLAAAVLPAAAFGALLLAVPGAGASAVPRAQVAPADTPTPAPPSTPSTTPFPPGPPTNLTATSVRAGSVTLSWTASTRGCCPIAGYTVMAFRAFYDVGFVVDVGNVTTATITANISRTTQYSFSVLARDDMGRSSALSNSVVVVTPNTDTGPDTTPPGAPSGLTVTGSTGSSADLSWSPATDDVGVTGYDVYHFDGVFISRLVATTAGTSATVPLSIGRNIFYVRARDAAGNLSIATGTVTVAGTSTSSPPVPPGSCRVVYTTQSRWTGGFVAAVTIHNTGTTPVTDWRLDFTFPGDPRIVSAWGATATQSGAAVSARFVDWNRTIPPGGSVTFGMQGTWTGSYAAPTAFRLNDVPCAVG